MDFTSLRKVAFIEVFVQLFKYFVDCIMNTIYIYIYIIVHTVNWSNAVFVAPLGLLRKEYLNEHRNAYEYT